MATTSPPGELSAAGWQVAAVAVLMAVLWISEALPVSITALLPLILFPLLGVRDLAATAAPYANPLIFLFLGGFLIALAVQRCGLHRRIALTILRFAGTRPDRIVLAFMVATAFLSLWLSNTATAAVMLPVGLAIAGALDPPNNPEHTTRFATVLMLGIAYGATIGGLGTLIGTPPNALFAAYMLEAHDRDIGFARWMAVGLPTAILLLPIAWLWLTRVAFPLPHRPIADATAIVDAERHALGPLSQQEAMTAGVFALTALLWLTRPLFNHYLPDLAWGDAQIALFGALLMFVLPGDWRRAEPLLTWAEARQLPWRVLLLFGGGLALAGAISETGLAEWIGAWTITIAGERPMLLALVLVTVILFLTELTSNTATAAAFLPVAGAAALGLGLDPTVLAAPVALAASCAFMMPVATPPNAIAFASGHVTIPQMCRAGVALNLVAIGVILAVGYTLVWLVLGA
jgi:sodium-dependent dicarboxylate transporter 2/3/5